MPSRSRATSAIRRLVAAWEISMSDFGLACWEAGIGGSLVEIPLGASKESFAGGSREPGAGGEAGRFRPIAAFDLLAVGGLHPRHLESPVGADHGEPVGLDGDDLAHLAAAALGVLRRERLGVEYLQDLAVERGPRAGRRIAATDERIDLPPGLRPVDMGVLRRAAALIGRLAFVLLDTRRLAGLHEVDGFEHRLDPERKQAVEVDGAERVGAADGRFLLQQHIAGI